MDIILTHEQADFDALAALLGVSLLNREAVPLLPRRMNRNVRAFYTLYEDDLPFTQHRDMPQESIDSVLLVDTQSLVTVKGMNSKTRVSVIDHHPLRPDLPDDWDLTIDATGACTTLLVEEIDQRELPLEPLHATLLLTGIYEDTGSLTYAHTTARDVRAAAWLMEHGASIETVADYLNPPLSKDQRKLYDRVLTGMENLSINGQNVVVARAEAFDLTDEISSVAHKVRDLLDPDGLFLLVALREGVRLVARSTTDNINVGEVASEFGGGGHERAASALVLAPDDAPEAEIIKLLDDTYQKLKALLPEHARPAITVGQIMSRSPHLLSPQTPAQEALQRMQRYGYEGFPVVQNGRVVGLLTRRAVDRAISHKLNLTAASLMDAGQNTVTADQSIEQLQRVMTASGWGQVPVVDQTSGDVVGIVTRTDLLKTLTREPRTPGGLNLSTRLASALPPGRLAFLKAVAGEATKRHVAVYIVGGFVRDLLLERPSLDFDVVVEGNAIALGKALVAEYGGRVVTHSRFGTAKWSLNDARKRIAARVGAKPRDLPDTLDLISARTEFYDHPTALPTVENSSIKMDLHRRDFTINTLAVRLDGYHFGQLLDPWGGLNDLNQGLVRVLHSLSFIDDPTRLLRAVRFEQRFDFMIEARTLELMQEALPLIKQVSGDRLRHELDLILAEPRAGAMLARLNQLGLLAAIHECLPWDAALGELLPAPNPAATAPGWSLPGEAGGLPARKAYAYLLWLGNLSEDEMASVGMRLRLPAGLQSILRAVGRLREMLPGLVSAKPSEVVEQLESIPLLAVFTVYTLSREPKQRRLLWRYATNWRKVAPATGGAHLREIGLPPSPAYKGILKRLRSAWLDGEIHSRDEEQALLDRLVREAREAETAAAPEEAASSEPGGLTER